MDGVLNLGKMDQLIKLLSNESLQIFLNEKSNKLQFCEITTIMKLLVDSNIPFSVEFNEGTLSQSPCFIFEITLSPTTTISVTFEVDS